MTEQLRDGRSTRWDLHRRARRLAIINAAIAAIEGHGPDALTGQIADKAGMPRTHVYRHFDGKQALDLAVSRHVALQIAEQIRTGLATQGSPREIISASISQHLGWIAAHPNLYRFLAQHAYAVNATGSPAVDDAKAAFAGELTTRSPATCGSSTGTPPRPSASSSAWSAWSMRAPRGGSNTTTCRGRS